MTKTLCVFLLLTGITILNSCKKEHPDTSFCTNKIADGNETAIDCGGSCEACPNYYLRGTLDSTFIFIGATSIAGVASEFESDTVGYPIHCMFSNETELNVGDKTFRMTLYYYIGCDSIPDDIHFRKSLFKLGMNDISGNTMPYLLISVKDSTYFSNADFCLAYGGSEQTGSSLSISRIGDIANDASGHPYFELEGEVTCKLYPYGVSTTYHQLKNAKFKLALK